MNQAIRIACMLIVGGISGMSTNQVLRDYLLPDGYGSFGIVGSVVVGGAYGWYWERLWEWMFHG